MHDKDCLRCETDINLYGHTSYDFETNEHYDIRTMIHKRGLSDKPLNMLEMLYLWKSANDQIQTLAERIEQAAIKALKFKLVEVNETQMECVFEAWGLPASRISISFSELERHV